MFKLLSLIPKRLQLVIAGLVSLVLVVHFGPYIYNSLTIDHRPPQEHFQAMLNNLLEVERVAYQAEIVASAELADYSLSEDIKHRFIVDFSQPETCQRPGVVYQAYASCFEWQLSGQLKQQPKSDQVAIGFDLTYQSSELGDGQTTLYTRYQQLDIQAIDYPDSYKTYPGFDEQAWSFLVNKWQSSDQPLLLDDPSLALELRTTRSSLRRVSQLVTERRHAITRSLFPSQLIVAADQRQGLVNQLLETEVYQLENCDFTSKGRHLNCDLKLNLRSLTEFYRANQGLFFGRPPRVIENLNLVTEELALELLIDVKTNLPVSFEFRQPTDLRAIYAGWQTVTKADFSWQFAPKDRILLPERVLTDSDLDQFRN